MVRRLVLGPVVGLAVLTFSTGARFHHDAPLAGPGCVGVGNGLGADFVVSGSGFTPGTTYIVQFTAPDGSQWYGVPTADAGGAWGQFWLPETAGVFSAEVFAYNAGQLGADLGVGCSWTV